jgi:nucleoside-diphosphate-sugar epimerase
VVEPAITVRNAERESCYSPPSIFGYGVRSPEEIVDKAYLVTPQPRCPVIEKARREIGYSPSIGIDEGLRRSLIWYKDNREAEDA